MSTIKVALKAAKSALDSHNYVAAGQEARKALEVDKNNYHARVFLGLALEKQDENEEAEKSYYEATGIKDGDSLAWQGLITLYEKQPGRKLDQLHDAALRLAQIYMDEDDKLKCQSVIDKYTLDAKKYGSRSQYKHSLEILLPSSPTYDFLEGRIPQPASTYIKIADIIQAEENEKISSEIGQRRTRLGSRIDQVTSEVRLEVFEGSPLESIYENIINWTQDDDIRREYEERLLKRASDILAVLPSHRKAAKRKQVQELARGLVILKHAFLLAWTITLEWEDVPELAQLDVSLLRQFVSLFPGEGLSKIVKAFLGSQASTFPRTIEQEHSSSEVSSDDEAIEDEDRLITMTEGLEESSSSILSHRFISQYYIFLEEYESAVDVARKGLERTRTERHASGLSLTNSSDALKIDLATALVHFQSPRHHGEARVLFDEILSKRQTDVACLLGIGLIYEEQEDYAKAEEVLIRALTKNNGPKIRSEAAWCKALNGNIDAARKELEICLPELEESDMRTKASRAQVLYRIGYCVWNEDKSSTGRKDRNGAYAYFLAALQADLSFAPAYTSLGVYYADYIRDRKRAKKCFLKAFELSTSEIEAAERLARMLAKNGSWDEVEAVAQRVVNSGKTRPSPGSKKKSLSWPYAALGVVQLNSQDYARSIVSFQSALRISPSDYHSWIGLGESYHNSGRYMAATRAFEHAEQVESTKNNNQDDTWFASYMLANVKRELGLYDDAITFYEEVLVKREQEFGVSIALIQCLVESAKSSLELGFLGRAVNQAVKALQAAESIMMIRRDAFNLWKAIGDACSIFVCVPRHAALIPRQQIISLFKDNLSADKLVKAGDWDHLDDESLAMLIQENRPAISDVSFCIRIAILAYKEAILISTNDIHIRAVAWYNLGWMQHLAYIALRAQTTIDLNMDSTNLLKTAVQCFKRAIESEAGNAEFWNALGVTTQSLSPQIAQHSFVRSLYLNDKSARVWTNLGGFYLQQNDLQLANEAFTRAQSADPDYAEAWLAQGLIAQRMGDSEEARQLFTHASGIADSSSVLIKQEYGLSFFDGLLQGRSSSNAADLLQPLLGLRQLHVQCENDAPFAHLSVLFAERIGDFEDASVTLKKLSDQLEASFEQTELPETLERFAQAKSDLARIDLAKGEVSSSARHAETALDLSTELQGSQALVLRLRLSAHMTLGLASYYGNAMDKAVESFQTVLGETNGNPDVICLLSQVLWAQGGDDERDVAREQLLNCVEKQPDHVTSALLLGAIALLDDDTDTLNAVTSDLEALQMQAGLTITEKAKIVQLLTTIATLHPNHGDKAISEMTQATEAIMLEPSQPQGWSQLSQVSDDPYPAEVAALTAIKAAPPNGSLEAQDLCTAISGTGKFADGQRAAMFAPWLSSAWQALSE